MRSTKFYILVLIALVFPFAASAHLEGEALYDNSYRVEVGHYPADIIYEKETVNFSIQLETEKGESIQNSNAWIRIAKGNDILFASADLSAADGKVDFDFVFPDAGEYEIMIRVTDKENDEDATVLWPITVEVNPALLVEGQEGNIRRNRFNLAVLTFILGGITGVLMARYRPRVNGNGNNIKKSN